MHVHTYTNPGDRSCNHIRRYRRPMGHHIGLISPQRSTCADAPRRRSSPPCVALQASECLGNPNRAVQYIHTLVPDEQYRERAVCQRQRVCASRLCHRHVGLYCHQQARQAGRQPEKSRSRRMIRRMMVTCVFVAKPSPAANSCEHLRAQGRAAHA